MSAQAAILLVMSVAGAVTVASTAFHAGFCSAMAFVYDCHDEDEKAAGLRRERLRSVVRAALIVVMLIMLAVLVVRGA